MTAYVVKVTRVSVDAVRNGYLRNGAPNFLRNATVYDSPSAARRAGEAYVRRVPAPYAATFAVIPFRRTRFHQR